MKKKGKPKDALELARRRLARARRELLAAMRDIANASTVPALPEQTRRESNESKQRIKAGIIGTAYGPTNPQDSAGKAGRVVFVSSKFKSAALGTRGAAGDARLDIDGEIVEVSDFRKLANPGITGVVPHGVSGSGTLGCFATDDDTGDNVAITAMHVTRMTEFPSNGQPPIAMDIVDDDGQRRLGMLVRGTETRVDAVSIAVDDAGEVTSYIPGIGELTGWRNAVPEDRGTIASVRGITTGSVQSGPIVYPSADLPGYRLEKTIIADVRTSRGDSGAALVDEAGSVLGFLVGRAQFNGRPLSIFSPAGLVQAICHCSIPRKEVVRALRSLAPRARSSVAGRRSGIQYHPHVESRRRP